MVTDGSQTIHVSQRIAGRQGLVLGGGAGDDDCSGRCIIHRHTGKALAAGHGRSDAIGHAGGDAEIGIELAAGVKVSAASKVFTFAIAPLALHTPLPAL